MWQQLYAELKQQDFMVVAVAEESRGAEHARQWIEAAKPEYWCLIDPDHHNGMACHFTLPMSPVRVCTPTITGSPSSRLDAKIERFPGSPSVSERPSVSR